MNINLTSFICNYQKENIIENVSKFRKNEFLEGKPFCQDEVLNDKKYNNRKNFILEENKNEEYKNPDEFSFEDENIKNNFISKFYKLNLNNHDEKEKCDDSHLARRLSFNTNSVNDSGNTRPVFPLFLRLYFSFLSFFK